MDKKLSFQDWISLCMLWIDILSLMYNIAK